MFDKRLMPITGINNAADYSALQKEGDYPSLQVRDAKNLNILPSGKIDMRAGIEKISELDVTTLWQSPLHGTVFAVIGDKWCVVNPANWSYEEIATIGEGQASHEILNHQVAVAGRNGLFVYNGIGAERLTIEETAPPFLAITGGSMQAGSYSLAASYVRDGKESSLSNLVEITIGENNGISVTLPLPMIEAPDCKIRLYMTNCNGKDLMRVGTYDQLSLTQEIVTMPKLGANPPFKDKSAMPTGSILRYWKGRLITANRNVLSFSEALAYHIHDERHGFIKLPQRITFVEPVEGGLWVGQVDHVLFLDGSDPKEFQLIRKSAQPPIPNSSTKISSNDIAGDLSQGSSPSVLWLAANGYVIGTTNGQCYEVQAGAIKGLSGNSGNTVVFERRVTTAIN